jgi:glycosyltransferase involved in cell wall biosynthesis
VRILHLLASPWWSGPTEIVAAVARAQREAGHQVTVAVDRKRAGGGAEEPAVPRLSELALLDEGGLELSVKSGPVAVLRDVARLKRRKVDVVHAHFSHDHLIARLGLPAGARLVRSLHAPRSIRWSLPRAHGYTVACEAMVPALGRQPCAVLPAPVPDGFEEVGPAGRPPLRARLGVDGAPLVGMASTFQSSRRHAVALEAFALLRAEVPSAKLVLLGDGALEASLRQRASAPDLAGAVHFAGYVNGPGFTHWLQALDELWVLGLGNDWSARVAAQGRACGARIIAVAEGALPAYADATVKEALPEAVRTASLAGARRAAQVARPRDSAREVLALYAAAGARR